MWKHFQHLKSEAWVKVSDFINFELNEVYKASKVFCLKVKFWWLVTMQCYNASYIHAVIAMHPTNSCLKTNKHEKNTVEWGSPKTLDKTFCSHSPPKQMQAVSGGWIQSLTTPGGVVIPLLTRVAAKIDKKLKVPFSSFKGNKVLICICHLFWWLVWFAATYRKQTNKK